MRGTRDTEEVFGPYAAYTESTLWPSIRDGHKDLEQIDVEEMPPQRAAACLSKLVRWARYEPTGEYAAIDDTDLREEEVRASVLGRHLAARALGLTEPMLHALVGETKQGNAADPRQVAAEMVVAMGELYPAWDLKDRIGLGIALTEKISDAYVIKNRSDT